MRHARKLRHWLMLLAWMLVVPAVAETATPTDVLLIYSQNRLLPANIQVDQGLNSLDADLRPRKVRFFTEFLDYPDFTGRDYEMRTADFLREKYDVRPPKMIIAGGYVALQFILQYRNRMFPGVPVVHIGVDRDFLKSLGELPADVVGVPIDFDVPGTIDLAMKLHPGARRMVVVTGTTEWADARRSEVRQTIAALKPEIPVEFWTGLVTNDLLKRLAALSPDTIVYTPGYFRDGAGDTFTPLESVGLMASVSSAPVYTIFSAHVGTGVVGGRMTTFVSMGQAARQLIDDLAEKKPVDSEALNRILEPHPQLDWRQLRRWNVSMSRVPEDAVLHYRTPTFWELYQVHTIVGAAVLLAQAVLIFALLVERGRRQRTARALLESQRHVDAAAKAAHLSTFNWNLEPVRDGDALAQGQRGAPAHCSAKDVQEFVSCVHPSDREPVLAAIERVIDHGEELDIEVRMVDKAGQVSWIAARGQASEDHHIVGVSMDITERKNADMQAVQDRAMLMHLSRVSTVGQLSAAIAHQLNQPLTAIRFNTEAAQKMLDRPDVSHEELKEVLEDVNAENTRAADIIRNLSALYRRGPLEAAAFDLNDLVLETLKLIKAELVWRHVTVRLVGGLELPRVRGSRIQLQQVLLNLLLNGMQAMTDTPPERRLMIIRTVADDRSVQVWIEDRGKGIAQGEMGRIFDPFWTTKEQGIGVGLAISRAIVEAHGGTISADNLPEGGAVFWMTLPISGAAEELEQS